MDSKASSSAQGNHDYHDDSHDDEGNHTNHTAQQQNQKCPVSGSN
jgi:hypothetical protein